MLSEKTQTEEAGEPDTLFAGLEPAAGLALAVSGGPDSMALLALFAQWRRGTGDTRPAVVLTVDHGLRPESAEECAYVAEVARHFGLEPRVLRWRPAAGTAISQTSARDGRFRLIFQAMRRLDLSHLLLAHHRDDQAETVVMRFLNGSGIDGMAGMARMSDRGGVTLVRPLLAYSKAELRAWLDTAGLKSFDDPSNLDPRHERTRVRQLMPQLAEAGGTVDAISRFSERAKRAADALETIAADLFARHSRIDGFGYCEADFAPLADQHPEIRIRLLRQAIAAVRGVRELRLDRLERAEKTLFEQDSAGLTLSGCWFARDGDRLAIAREARNLPRLPRRLEPGQTLVWDNRFRITLDDAAAPGLSVAPLGETGWHTVRDLFDRVPDVPTPARASLPAISADKTLVAIPGLDSKTLAEHGVSIKFDTMTDVHDEALEEGPP